MDYIYLFNFCFSLSEGGWGTISVHKTKKGAQMAMDFHKNKALSGEDFDEYFDCDWCVQEIKLEE